MDNKNFQIEGTKIQLPVDAENMKEYDITYIIDQRHGFILDCPDPYNQYYHNYWGRRELIQVKTLFGVDKNNIPFTLVDCAIELSGIPTHKMKISWNRILYGLHTEKDMELACTIAEYTLRLSKYIPYRRIIGLDEYILIPDILIATVSVWVLVVSNAPVGNTIESVSGSRTNTRDIRAKVKYFAGGNITIKGLNKKTDTPFEFADYSGNGNSGYSTADFPSLFTYRNNTPGIIDVDGQGRITTKAAGAGSFTVFYRGTTELCTVNVNVKLSYKDMLALTPTPTPKQTETAAPTQPPKQPETAKPTEPPKQTEVPKPTKAPEQAKPTQPPKQPETVKPIAAPKPVQLVKPVSTKFTVKTKNVTYNGKAQKPSVTVYAGNKKISSKYYSISCKNNKNVGYGTVTVKGKGSYAKYSGSDTFKINLKGVSLSSVKAQKKKMAVYWKKTGGNQGYQVQYSTSKRFSSKVKTVRLSAGKKSVTIKNIPAKKRYYVRIRSYKKVGNKIWYTGWSKVRNIKTK